MRADLGQGGSPSSWPDVIPQHPKDLLQSALALEGDELIIRSDMRGGNAGRLRGDLCPAQHARQCHAQYTAVSAGIRLSDDVLAHGLCVPPLLLLQVAA